MLCQSKKRYESIAHRFFFPQTFLGGGKLVSFIQLILRVANRRPSAEYTGKQQRPCSQGSCRPEEADRLTVSDEMYLTRVGEKNSQGMLHQLGDSEKVPREGRLWVNLRRSKGEGEGLLTQRPQAW